MPKVGKQVKIKGLKTVIKFTELVYKSYRLELKKCIFGCSASPLIQNDRNL